MINWMLASDEKPKNDEPVWVLLDHYKRHYPASFKIAGGMCEYGINGHWRVCTDDYDGCGSNSFYPENDSSSYDESFSYWCRPEDIKIPEEMIELREEFPKKLSEQPPFSMGFFHE